MTNGSFPSPPLPQNRLRTHAHAHMLDEIRVGPLRSLRQLKRKYSVNVRRTKGD